MFCHPLDSMKSYMNNNSIIHLWLGTQLSFKIYTYNLVLMSRYWKVVVSNIPFPCPHIIVYWSHCLSS